MPRFKSEGQKACILLSVEFWCGAGAYILPLYYSPKFYGGVCLTHSTRLRVNGELVEPLKISEPNWLGPACVETSAGRSAGGRGELERKGRFSFNFVQDGELAAHSL